MKTKYLVVLLLLSVLANAFLGGMMLSDHLHRGGMGKDGRPPMGGMIFDRLIDQSEKISPEGRTTVAEITSKYQAVADKNGEGDKHQLFEEIQKIMTAPKFDKQKMEDIHLKLNSGEAKFKESIGRMMIEIASSLSDEDRILFFKELFPPRPPMPMGERPHHKQED